MQYCSKLKMAAEEIKEVLQRYDIAATIVMHTPGFAEYVYRIDPSYSCARLEGAELRITARLQKDFAGDKEAWTKKVTDTANMLLAMLELNNRLAENTAAAIKMLGTHVEIEHVTTGSSGHNEQNN